MTGPLDAADRRILGGAFIIAAGAAAGVVSLAAVAGLAWRVFMATAG